MERFVDKVDVITGGGKGIGEACAERFACEGARVAVLDIRLADAQATSSTIGDVNIHGGVFIHTHDQAADLIRRLNHPHLKQSFDCYHQQRTAGNLIYGLEVYQGLYPTVHIGDVPTRQELGNGEINFPNIARKLHELKFDGFIGMEFSPSGTEAAALQKVKEIFIL